MGLGQWIGLTECTHDNLPDVEFLWIHSIVIVGLWFSLFTAQANVKHCDVDACCLYGMMLFECCIIMLLVVVFGFACREVL